MELSQNELIGVIVGSIFGSGTFIVVIVWCVCSKHFSSSKSKFCCSLTQWSKKSENRAVSSLDSVVVVPKTQKTEGLSGVQNDQNLAWNLTLARRIPAATADSGHEIGSPMQDTQNFKFGPPKREPVSRDTRPPLKLEPPTFAAVVSRKGAPKVSKIIVDKENVPPSSAIPKIPKKSMPSVMVPMEIPKRQGSGVILSVDATPSRSGGYFIVKDLNVCEFYSIPTGRLPWRLNNVSRRGNAAEFEMKNLMFALLNWSEVIVGEGKLWLYTDNMAVQENGIGHQFGDNVRSFLSHLSKCKNVKIMNNKNHHVHRFRHAQNFEKYLVPADHLSRGYFNGFYSHVQIHFPNVSSFREALNLMEVEDQIVDWIRRRCGSCGFHMRISNSLRDDIKKRHRDE